MKSVFVVPTIALLMLAETAYGRPSQASVQEYNVLFLHCYASFSSTSDFSILSRVLNHPSNQKAVLNVGLEKLAVFLEDMSANQHKQLALLLNNDVDTGDQVILNSMFGESANWYFFPKTRTFLASWNVYKKWMQRMLALQTPHILTSNGAKCPCKMCLEGTSQVCIPINSETALEFMND